MFVYPEIIKKNFIITQSYLEACVVEVVNTMLDSAVGSVSE